MSNLFSLLAKRGQGASLQARSSPQAGLACQIQVLVWFRCCMQHVPWTGHAHWGYGGSNPSPVHPMRYALVLPPPFPWHCEQQAVHGTGLGCALHSLFRASLQFMLPFGTHSRLALCTGFGMGGLSVGSSWVDPRSSVQGQSDAGTVLSTPCRLALPCLMVSQSMLIRKNSFTMQFYLTRFTKLLLSTNILLFCVLRRY